MSSQPPLTPAECDLRNFPYMPLHVQRLRDSDLAATIHPEACWYATLLWAASWHQVPAGSIPDDDAVLARMCNLGRDLRTFRKHKAGALHGFVKCSDGRFYHPLICEDANRAWKSKLEGAWRKEVARIKKHNQRNGTELEYPTFEAFVQSKGFDVPGDVPEDSATMSLGTKKGQSEDAHQMSLGTGATKEREREKETERETLNTDCLDGARARDDDGDEGEEHFLANVGPTTVAVSEAAGFILTEGNAKRSDQVVQRWLDKGISPETALFAVRAALPKLDGPSSSLARFTSHVEHAHAQTKAKPQAPAPKPASYDFEGEDEAMSAIRKDIAEAIGERTYASFQDAFRLTPEPAQNALRITMTGAVRVYDGERMPKIDRIARAHGFQGVWA